MRVLIIEEEPGGGAAAQRRLNTAGHDAVSCAEPGMALPCRGLADGSTCPIEESPVDVAVLALRSEAVAPVPVPLGIVCVARQHIPTVAVGAHERPEYRSAAVVLARDSDEIVTTVERVAAQPLAEHSRAARSAVRAMLDCRGHRDVDASVWVERGGDRLQVHVATSRPVSPMIGHAAAVRALGAVRGVDPTARVIGVTVS